MTLRKDIFKEEAQPKVPTPPPGGRGFSWTSETARFFLIAVS